MPTDEQRLRELEERFSRLYHDVQDLRDRVGQVHILVDGTHLRSPRSEFDLSDEMGNVERRFGEILRISELTRRLSVEDKDLIGTLIDAMSEYVDALQEGRERARVIAFNKIKYFYCYENDPNGRLVYSPLGALIERLTRECRERDAILYQSARRHLVIALRLETDSWETLVSRMKVITGEDGNETVLTTLKNSELIRFVSQTIGFVKDLLS